MLLVNIYISGITEVDIWHQLNFCKAGWKNRSESSPLMGPINYHFHKSVPEMKRSPLCKTKEGRTAEFQTTP
jgi:hypothetical protein